MNNPTPVKLTKDGIDFLRRLATNRIRAETDEAPGVYPYEALELIEKYFKLNNDRYLELIKMEYKNV